MAASLTATIHILRHGQSIHNVVRPYPYRDPPLTDVGVQQAMDIRLPAEPDLLLISPMTRTIETALLAFPGRLKSGSVKVQVWPDLREAHGALCNIGVSRPELEAKFPQFDFSSCRNEWDYPPHIFDDAAERAERVRRRLKDLSASYKNIFLVTHRAFAAFLVQGERFDVCECRSYRFASREEADKARDGINIDRGIKQDFGPSVLLPIHPQGGGSGAESSATG
ncbi:histidine phosphatase superfamily [Thelonectria olida]|uniref:Histidine phosphatase superfamily n=1 Tax=Thelonectria olida TaxID=1576542 RepID=A0A9P9AVS3_9HYPO|nr:histidine phosphatase superfamily [Thelonectria olida]